MQTLTLDRKDGKEKDLPGPYLAAATTGVALVHAVRMDRASRVLAGPPPLAGVRDRGSARRGETPRRRRTLPRGECARRRGDSRWRRHLLLHAMDTTPLWSSPFWGYRKGHPWRGRKRAVEGTLAVLSRAALALAVAAPAAMDGHHPLSGSMAALWISRDAGLGKKGRSKKRRRKEKGACRGCAPGGAPHRRRPSPVAGKMKPSAATVCCERCGRGEKWT
jgi:hypothetical protein